MKKLLSLLVLLCLEKNLHAQYIYTIKADSVKITNSCDTAELIIENHTQDVCGFLFNKGKGRTEFRRGMMKISDSIYAIGCDTLRLSVAWLQGGNTFGTTGYFGTRDNNHIDYYTNGIKRGRWTNTGNFLVGGDTDYGYKMAVDGPVYGQYFTNSTTLLTAGDGALRLRWGGGGGSYIDFYNQGNNNRRGFISSGADGRPLNLYDQVGLSLSTTPFLSIGTEWPTAQNTKFSLTTAFNSTQDPMRVANIISADGLSSTSYLRVKASGNTILGEGDDYGYKLAVNGTTYSQFYTNSTTPLGAGGSGALRLRWGGGEGTYVDFYKQGNTNRRGYIGSASDSRPLVITDSIGFTFGYTPYVTLGLETGAPLPSRFTIASNRSTGWDAFTILGSDSVYNKDLVVKANGNVVLAGGYGTDNGKKLQVYGTSWFGNNVFISHPTYATGGMGAGMGWVGNNIFQIYGGPSHESLTFGPANDITSNVLIKAPSFYATSTGGGNYYVPSSGGEYTTANSPGNSGYIYHKFTIAPPAANSGNGEATLVEINKPVNRGASDGKETGLRILFSVTGTANNLRAMETVNGDVRLHTTSGRTSIGLDGSSTITSRLDVSGEEGYNQLRLRKKYTPTSSTDTNGAEGDVSWDDNYIYIKTSSGWKRSALSTF